MSAGDGLRGFLARLLGWDDLAAVDRALRSVDLAATQRAPLVLCGDGNLVPVAHALHRRAVGVDRPFVLADPRRGDTPATVRAPVNYRSGVAAFEAATDGSLCVRSRRPPRAARRLRRPVRDERCAPRRLRPDSVAGARDPYE